MENKNAENKPGIEIDLKKLLSTLLSKIWLIALVAVFFGIFSFLGTYFFVEPQYQSSAMFYVNNSSRPTGSTTSGITTGDINASRGLVSSYLVILNTGRTMEEIIAYAGVNLTDTELMKMISAEIVDDTEMFRVVVEAPDPNEAKLIADAIAHILPERISSVIKGSSAEVVDVPKMPKGISSPNYTNNAFTGFLIGLVLTICVIVLKAVFDVTIRSEDDIAQNTAHPILASVPDLIVPTKGGYYYGNGRQIRETAAFGEKQYALVGKNITFAAAEAYNLLRTKLQFSFAGDKLCRVIAVSSAMAGEGKSLSSINLAYSMSQLGKKVLLIDCDMRRPSLNAKLPIKKYPGLSNYLSGQSSLDCLIQPCGIQDEENAFSVVSAGRNPPNPIALLSSEMMSKMLDILREDYDYIILDMPPVGEVSDALVVAQHTDGVLLVVRQNYCNRVVFNDTVRQFEFVNARILGIVCNCSTKNGTGYTQKYYKNYSEKNIGKRYAGKFAAVSGVASGEKSENKDTMQK